jgi:hypothetical protein
MRYIAKTCDRLVDVAAGPTLLAIDAGRPKHEPKFSIYEWPLTR